jgi:hypothetical protein
MTYAIGTLVGCVRYQQSVYLQDLRSSKAPYKSCVSPKDFSSFYGKLVVKEVMDLKNVVFRNQATNS